MHITNELIHNPGVNERLDEMEVNFVPGKNKRKLRHRAERESNPPPKKMFISHLSGHTREMSAPGRGEEESRQFWTIVERNSGYR